VTARLRSKSFGEAMRQGRAATKPWRSRAHRPPTDSAHNTMRRTGEPLAPSSLGVILSQSRVST
jgi:hypothetical protein